MKVVQSLDSLFALLKTSEEKSKKVKLSSILEATGWKRATFQTYWAKGQLSDFLSEVEKDVYEASNLQDLSPVEFSKLLSQSKHRRGLGHNCRSKLSKALLGKARDNMMLALELYNRPSLQNRMDAFVMCFCTAWEQFLKATLIEQHGEDFIFRAQPKKGIKETISLRECLGHAFPKESKVRKNVEQIVLLRDQAVHLLMPEIQGIMSRMFQSGVLNFCSKFEAFTETPLLNNSHTGMISLVGEFKSPPASLMRSTYGNVAAEIIELAESCLASVEEINDIEFAIPLNVKLVFASENDEGTTIALTRADQGMQALKQALVIEKPVDRSRSHPFLQKNAITRINELLAQRFSEQKLSEHIGKNSSTGRFEINKNCFAAVVRKNKWKSSNNHYHHKNDNPELHYYSEDLVEEFIRKVMEHPGYLDGAKREQNQRKRRD